MCVCVCVCRRVCVSMHACVTEKHSGLPPCVEDVHCANPCHYNCYVCICVCVLTVSFMLHDIFFGWLTYCCVS